MSHFEIRLLSPADLPRLKEIDRATFPEEEQYDDGMYHRILESRLSLVAIENGAVIGYVFVQINPYTHVRSLAVHPSHQRQGYGSALMRAVIENGEHEVDLLVDELNEPAMRLYESLGFQRAEMCPTMPPKHRMVLLL